MKPHCTRRKDHALTLLEVVVTIFALAVLMSMLMPAGSHSESKAKRIDCVNQLHEISLAARIWEQNHGDNNPIDVSVANGGLLEVVARGNAVLFFQVMLLC